MKYYSERDIKKHITPGETIWALAFEFDIARNAMTRHQPPIQGMIATDSQKHIHEDRMDYLNHFVQKSDWRNFSTHFVPFTRKNSLAWYKAVSLSSRLYADTEQEAKELYNELIQTTIARNLMINSKLTGLLIPNVQTSISILNPNLNILDFTLPGVLPSKNTVSFTWDSFMHILETNPDMLDQKRIMLSINETWVSNSDIDIANKTVNVADVTLASFEEITKADSDDIKFGVFIIPD